jgi:hypothetical protein
LRRAFAVCFAEVGGLPMEDLRTVIKELLVLLGAFFGATLLAELLGAVNTGTALTFGQLGIAAAFTWIVLRSS